MAKLPNTNLDTLIVTVNYRTSRLVTDLILSLQPEIDKLGKTHMVIVDNASGDDSVDYIQKFIDENTINWVTVVTSKDNAGYAAGNNLAINSVLNENIDIDRIWFLNPDTKVKAEAGTELIRAMKENSFHIVGSRLEDDDGTLQCSHFNFPGIISELSAGLRLGIFDKIVKKHLVRAEPSNTPIQADWLAGASFMVSNKYIKKIGLIDDDYFLYFEELDFCLQGKRNNMPCWYIPSSKVYHAVGAATGISDHRKKAPRRPQYWFDSRRRFFLKNYGAIKLIGCDLAFTIGYAIWLLRSKITNNVDLTKEPPNFLKDFIKSSFLFRGFSLKKLK
ncbi:glycosyltransferase family 2 protein [Colwellia sp. Bg11-28]|uniref:glycosyltransferase family 2 protein n=1 Tax=Colwellia sp. Bg11-28 TaxID=2058305 RepID=UPI000C34F862|nr:glycosyltransferase family 2 protein [Colwellia sp. Bg11-28]PKH85167.1 glycosyl transferase family 2 [Colwellia sp. Bg11-28]